MAPLCGSRGFFFLNIILTGVFRRFSDREFSVAEAEKIPPGGRAANY